MMFKAFARSSEDQTGLGLGLSISREAVKAGPWHTLSVRDIPGNGCVFTMDFPLVEDVAANRPYLEGGDASLG